MEEKTLAGLLDRARQTQQELQDGGNINARTTMMSSNVVTSVRDLNALTSVEATKNDERIETKEAARRAEKEERMRQERKRKEEEIEEEERRRLHELFGDDYDDETFEFETVMAREERIACERREERRKRLKAIVDQNDTSQLAVGSEHAIKNNVDRPRNELGVIQSELEDSVIVAKSQADLDATTTAIDRADETNDSSDSFDMFDADNVTPVLSTNDGVIRNVNRAVANNAQECDDAEGYYKATIGEIITLPKERQDDDDNGEDDELHRTTRFRVLGIIGKGVFSSVIKCIEEKVDDSSVDEGRVVAMKVIRNNEVMARAAAKEMRILRKLCHQSTKTTGNKMKQSTKDGNTEEEEEDVEERKRRERENHSIVRLVDVNPELSSTATDWYLSSSEYAAPPLFRSHCVFLFEFMPYNLREVLSKFGKNVGINLSAVMSYARQLLCALAHLERHRVVHADLKPDNILVSANFSTVKLADFGSAFFETDFDNDPTPYLVSRFYRPPEVILGLEYDRMVDLWSASVTLAELFTGLVLFPGKTNNDMLVRFMDCLGPLSHKMAKRHALSYTRMGLQPHFEVGVTGGTYQLRKQNVDRVTGKPVCNLVNVLSTKPESRLVQVLLRASKGGGAAERVEVLKLADLLNRCLSLDPTRRLSVREALRHDFFIKKKKKIDTT